MKHPNNIPLVKCLLASLAFLTLGWGKALAQDAMLFERVEDNAASRMLQETLVDVSAGVVLDMSPVMHEELRKKNLGSWQMDLPCPPEFQEDHNIASWHLELTRFFAHPTTVTVGLTTERGYEELQYLPQLQSFRVAIDGKAVGSLTLMNDHIVGSFHQHGRQFDVMHKSGNRYVLADMNQLRHHEPFECGVVDSDKLPVRSDRKRQSTAERMDGGCVEIALDLDFFTWSTFNNVDNATEWALAMMAGVEAIYTQELNGLALLQASYVHIWQTSDPMSAYVQDAGAMLDSFRNTWQTNSALNSVQRDMTHLISKRTNTGTGGIAWLNVNCGSYAYGFSANLSNTTNYNINSYSWNLDVVSHELGHNFGANHTHWCGWPGGAIDNCASAEGGCSNGPSVGSGTIMSYCHTTSTGKTLVFHPLVESNALEPGIEGGSCYTFCEEYTPPECAITGITPGNQMACDPVTGLYTQQVFVSFEYPPADGFLNVNGENWGFNFSPQAITIVGEPANGESVDVTAFFTTDDGCTLSVPDAYTRRDPCCGNLRFSFVDPEANILRIRNVADCPTDIAGWGLLSPTEPYHQLTELIGPGQSTVVGPGEEFQLSWASGLAGDWLMLFLPTNSAHDYVQWGPNGSPLYFEVYDELASIWPTGNNSYIQALPPYSYDGNGDYGVDTWSGEAFPCLINEVTATASECDPVTNTYTLTFEVDAQGVPETGGIVVNGTLFPIDGPLISGELELPADGTWVNLDVSFEDEGTCATFLGNAVFGPGPCENTCANDVNGNGAVDVADVLLVLSDFGCAADCNAATDIDGDGGITVSDVLALLSSFGQNC
ncbi:MAG: hypothetical protein CL822_00840 [Crocinitomicaceae bacterium]|nr:hypothetical protein [Crocinitomicaceae bacterium]